MAILMFDGECHLCDRSVQFILKHDRTESIQFASLQSPIGQRLLKEHGVPDSIDSLIFIEGASYYVKSDAMFNILPYLKKRWQMAGLGSFYREGSEIICTIGLPEIDTSGLGRKWFARCQLRKRERASWMSESGRKV